MDFQLELPEVYERELIIRVVMLLTEKSDKPMSREDVEAAMVRSEIEKMDWPDTIDY